MARRDTSPEAVAREWLGSNGPEMVFVGDVVRLIKAERARVRRIVRQHKERLRIARDRAEAAGRTGVASHRQSDMETCDYLLAALREPKGGTR